MTLSMNRLANHVDFSAFKPIYLLTKTNIHSFEIELYWRKPTHYKKVVMALDTTWGIIFFVCACIVATSFMVKCCCCLFNNWTAFKFCILGPPLYCFKKTCGRCIDSDKEVHHPDQEQNQHLAGPILAGPEVRSSTI